MSAVPRVLYVCLAIAALACGPEGREPAAPESASEPGQAAESQQEEAGDPAPDFTLPVLEGGEVTLTELRGQTVLIDFWATWCPPCEFQIPILNEVYRDYRDRGVEVLGVSVDTEGPGAVAAYLEKHEAVYPILMGSESLARKFGAPGFPALIVVGPDGRIHQRHVGLVERPDLEAILAEVAGVEPPAGDDSEDGSPDPA